MPDFGCRTLDVDVERFEGDWNWAIATIRLRSTQFEDTTETVAYQGLAPADVWATDYRRRRQRGGFSTTSRTRRESAYM